MRLGKFLDVFKTGDQTYDVTNRRNQRLGRITYYMAWHRYVFEPDVGTIYSWDCLKPLYNFMMELGDNK